MRCEQAREAISAHLDGEAPGARPEAVEVHLRRCPVCTAFVEAADLVHRWTRVRPAEPVPDLVEPILATAPRPARPTPAAPRAHPA